MSSKTSDTGSLLFTKSEVFCRDLDRSFDLNVGIAEEVVGNGDRGSISKAHKSHGP
jgi:hypothetical protein